MEEREKIEKKKKKANGRKKRADVYSGRKKDEQKIISCVDSKTISEKMD